MSKKILIVDDERRAATSLTNILRSEGLDAVFVTDPRMVTRMLKRNNFDLIILDINMPS